MAEHEQIVDRAARDQAIAVLHTLLSGELNRDGLKRRWPVETADKAVVCIGLELVNFDVEPEAEEELLRILKMLAAQALLFLQSDLPYAPGAAEPDAWPFANAADLTAARQWAPASLAPVLRQLEELSRQVKEYPRQARLQAAGLLHEYLHGGKTLRELQDGWVLPQADKGVTIVLGKYLSDLPLGHFQTFIGTRRGRRIQDVLARCERFFRTDLLYTWPDFSRPLRIPLAILSGLLTAGAALPPLMLIREVRIEMVIALSLGAVLVMGYATTAASDLIQRIIVRSTLDRGVRRYWPFMGEREL